MEMGTPSKYGLGEISLFFVISLEKQKKEKREGLKKGCLVSGGTSKSFLGRIRHLYDPWRLVGVVAVFTRFAPTYIMPKKKLPRKFQILRVIESIL